MASTSSGLADSQRRNKLQTSNPQVYITVFKAFQLPVLKESFVGKNRQFYLNVSDGITTRKTKPIRSTAERAATWNEKLGPFDSSSSRQITLSLYSRRKTSKDELIGTLILKSIAQTKVSHPIECNLEPQPNIELTIEIIGTLAAPVRNPVEEVAATDNALTNDDEPGKVVAEASAAMDEAGIALISINLHEEWKSTLEGIQWVMGVVGDLAELNPYAKLAYDALSLLPKIFTAQFERDENVQALSTAMRDAFNLTQAEELLTVIKPNSNQALILKLMLKHIKICSDVIQKYAQDQEFSKRLLRYTVGSVSAKIKALCNTLLELRDDLLRNAAISTQIAVEVVKKNVEILSTQISDIEYDAKIDDLPYKSGWTFTSTKNGCIAGTRTAFLEHILAWIRNSSSERVLILFGQAGTGKSTIAFEIASLYCIEYHICPYFSFSRADISKGEDYHLFTTIIRDLADRHPTFKSALGALIKDKTHLRKSANFNTLFDSLLIPSLENVGDNDIPELIVIDAVDESSDPSKLAAFLAQSLNRLPKNYRILITSRPEHDIKLEFITGQKKAFATLEMNDPRLAARTEDDIRVYLREHLPHSDFEKYGEAIVKKSEGLFQWVVVATGYLKKPPPGFTRTACMRGILAQTLEDKKYTQDLMTPLYTLYRTVLAGYFTAPVAQTLFCSVMSHLFAAVEPMSVDILTVLRNYMSVDREEDAVLAIVQHLGSLLSNTSSEQCSQPIIPLHISFRDFLVNPERRHTFSVDLPTAHEELAHACLDIMLEKLEFNICKLETSYLRNSDVPDLQVRIAKCIHPSLQYACRFWHQHVGQITVDDILLDKLAMFFGTKFLNWLEVVSLISQIPRAASALASLIGCLVQVGENATKTSKSKLDEITSLVTDSSRFLGYFAHAIATSAPHIYISTLPFAPALSYISQTYSDTFPLTLSLQCGRLNQWPALEMTIGSSSAILSVAVSPDGQWIATGSGDHTVRLWNLTTGMQEGKTFVGHTERVDSVAFSPSGQHIVSGSKDNTVRVWNLSTGETDVMPLVGHTGKVHSVVLSPSGEHIASGSEDCTICLWRIASFTMLGRPLTGHGGPVNAVAFSPDGKYIVSGSDDKAIYLWNVSTQTMEGCPFTGHTDRVTSVAFSPDGHQIVSGSENMTICIWDVSTHTMLGRPVLGHAHYVTSLSFSPNGKWLASGSWDNTIFIWKVANGVLEGRPMRGHTGAVMSVAFSPDSRHAVSSSLDGGISVWNIPPPPMIEFEDSFSGHTNWIESIALSLDGQKIFSCSSDTTVCVWDVASRRKEGTLSLSEPHLIPSSVSSSPNGQWIAAGTFHGHIALWETSTGRLHATLFGHSGITYLPTSGRITTVVKTIAFSPDGRYILSGSADSTICMWDVSLGTMAVEPFKWHTSEVYAVAFSLDGKHIFSASGGGIICDWNIPTQSLQQYSYTGYTSNIWCATVSLDGHQAAFGMDDGTVHVIDLLAESIKGRILKDPRYTSFVFSVCFSPDGKMVASGSADSVYVWDVSTMEGRLLPGHTSAASCVVFSSDGNRIVSCSHDRTIRVWPVPDLTKASTIESGIAFTDDSIVNDDGWICGSQRELLMWIPPIHRPSLYRPSNIFILGEHETRLDTSKFVHGLNWTRCRHR